MSRITEGMFTIRQVNSEKAKMFCEQHLKEHKPKLPPFDFAPKEKLNDQESYFLIDVRHANCFFVKGEPFAIELADLLCVFSQCRAYIEDGVILIASRLPFEILEDRVCFFFQDVFGSYLRKNYHIK